MLLKFIRKCKHLELQTHFIAMQTLPTSHPVTIQILALGRVEGAGFRYILEAELTGVVDVSVLQGAQEASRWHLGLGPE